MTIQEFDDTLQALMHAKPFRPFVVECTDGESFVIDGDYVVRGPGDAAFLGPGGVPYLFYHSTVRRFVPMSQEAMP